MIIEGLLGLIDKMRIEVYPSKEYNELEAETIYVQFNPEKYIQKHNVVFCEGQAMGSTGSDLKFNKIEEEEVTFDFLFDSSGVAPPGKTVKGKGPEKSPDIGGDITASLKPAIVNPATKIETVEKEVENFRKSLMGYNGDKHQTAYLKLLWGGYSLSCRLKSMDIEYSLFRKDGRPLRAKIKCLFKGTTDYKVMIAEENKQSPDLTHTRVMMMNDSLALLSEDIYENNNYYIDVARSNKLLSFRKISTGKKINFPPIK